MPVMAMYILWNTHINMKVKEKHGALKLKVFECILPVCIGKKTNVDIFLQKSCHLAKFTH